MIKVTSEDAICSCATGMTLYTRDCVSNLAGRETVPAFYCENDCVDCWLSMKSKNLVNKGYYYEIFSKSEM